MVAKIDGTTGIDLIQDGAVSTPAKLGGQVVTSPKLSGGQSGNAPIIGARAWCVFDGTLTGTNPPIAGGNVTSVTRNGVGDYTVNFTTAMPDTALCIVGSTGASGNGVSVHQKGAGTYSSTSATLQVRNQVSNAVSDDGRISVAIFR